jgi:hypothetical protein
MPELLHMQLLAKGHLVDNLAPSSQTKEYQFNQVKRAIFIATALIGLIGLLVAGWFFKLGLDNKEAFNQAVQDTVIQEHRYSEAAKNFPATPVSAADLKLAVELDQSIAAYPKSPRRMMLVVSAALELSSEIQLDRLRWAFTNDLNIKDEDNLLALPASNLQPTASVMDDPAKLIELGYVNAQISNFNGDYRAALNSVNKFVANLKANKQVATVEVLQAPVNVSSYVGLQGSTTDEQSTQRQPALFKLKVILKSADALVETPLVEQVPSNQALGKQLP